MRKRPSHSQYEHGYSGLRHGELKWLGTNCPDWINHLINSLTFSEAPLTFRTVEESSSSNNSSSQEGGAGVLLSLPLPWRTIPEAKPKHCVGIRSASAVALPQVTAESEAERPAVKGACEDAVREAVLQVHTRRGSGCCVPPHTHIHVHSSIAQPTLSRHDAAAHPPWEQQYSHPDQLTWWGQIHTPTSGTPDPS